MNTKNDLWSREILVEFEEETGCVSLEVVTLTGNGPSDSDVAYEGRNLSFVGWLEGVCENNALDTLLDLYDFVEETP